jgi:anti-sigma regulatory factor (Ser/Thr protein kinase)
MSDAKHGPLKVSASEMTWPLRTYITLAALPVAATWARRLVSKKIRAWGLESLTDTAELLVSELVTNAVRASGEPNPDEAKHYEAQPHAVKFRDTGKIPCVRLRISTDGKLLLIEVWDRNPLPPIQGTLDDNGMPSPETEGGRGLFLVGFYSVQWGYYYPEEFGLGSRRIPAVRDPMSHRDEHLWGKVVWCTAADRGGISRIRRVGTPLGFCTTGRVDL